MQSKQNHCSRMSSKYTGIIFGIMIHSLRSS
nr:MAG TPA: hypothetical protein [Caudoviricetes sp.]